MKRMLALTLVIVLIAAIVSHRAEISEAIDDLFDSGNVVRWQEISCEKSNLGSLYKNHFTGLNEQQKKAYNHILDELYGAEYEFPAMIQIPLLSGDELTEIIMALKYDNPTLMCLGRDSTLVTSDGLCYIQPGYTMTPAVQRTKINTLKQKCQQILSAMPQGADEFKKELFIHDYIVNNCTYDFEVAESSSTPYSCLVESFSACEGYSKAVKLLCEMAGIECYTVSGDAVNYNGETEGHMWNIVKIDDEYYHLDVTWDDPITQDKGETLSHVFFNLNDREISTDHFNFERFFDCTSTKANYFTKADRVFDHLDKNATDRLKKIMAQSEDGHIEIRFSNEKYYQQAINQLITNGGIYKLASSANRIYGSGLNTQSVGYIENKERFILDLYF